VADLGNLPDWVKAVAGAGVGAPALGILKFLLGNKVRADRCSYCAKNDEWRYTGGFARGFWILVGVVGAIATMGAGLLALLDLAPDPWAIALIGCCGLVVEFTAFRLVKRQRNAWKCTACGHEEALPGDVLAEYETRQGESPPDPPSDRSATRGRGRGVRTKRRR
jgi:xanthosine utilization system XapX-like protein